MLYPPKPIDVSHFNIAQRLSTTLLGISMICFGIFLLYIEKRYTSEGVLTDGVILEKTIDEGAKGVSYHVKYSFDLTNGDSLLAKDSFSLPVWKSLSVGENIDVLYLPDKPQMHSRFTFDDNYQLAYGFILVGLFSALCFPFAGLHNTLLCRKQIRLARMLMIPFVTYGFLLFTGLLGYMTYYTYLNRELGGIILFTALSLLWLSFLIYFWFIKKKQSKL
ncbi:MAG: hypothetical protein H6908_02155 [Hyphomicrobiales bacterium]|nr:hypothetical protein [Hyphomicrobiales bacterium]